MKVITRLYTSLLVGALLLPTFGFGWDDIDSSISQLTSSNPLLVLKARDYLMTRYPTYHWKSKRKIELELIKIINIDDGIADTVNAQLEKPETMKFVKENKPAFDSILGDAKTSAMYLTGILRITGALPHLSKKLNYVPAGRSARGDNALAWPYPHDFPAAVAMTLMGDTAIPYLIEIAKKHPDENTRQLAGRTIQEIGWFQDTKPMDESFTPHKYVKPLEDAFKLSTDSTEQQNLDNIIKRIKDLY